MTLRAKKYSSLYAVVEKAIALAVAAHIRHAETNYDALLIKGLDRTDARLTVLDSVQDIVRKWKEN